MGRFLSAWERLAAPVAVRRAIDAGFHLASRWRVQALDRLDPIAAQERTLHALIRRARNTRLGRDHRFDRIDNIAAFQAAVPIRSYEALWDEYLREPFPLWDNLTWPGRIPYLALTSGTTQGATKYIPVTREMAASNGLAARTMVSYHVAAHPDSRLFCGRMFFLGGSADLKRVAPGVEQGDLSGIAARELSPLLRPFTYPPLALALESDWERKLALLAEQSRDQPIRLVGGVPSWLLMLFERLLAATGKSTLVEVWPDLEVVVHGGVKFDPYRATFRSIVGSDRVRMVETYACSEGFLAFGDPTTELLRLTYDHGIFYEFIPAGDLDSPRPTRHWLGNAQTGINYAVVVSTCAGLWAHVIGDTIRFESLNPPLLTFTGRTRQTLSAFGEHLIGEELERAVARAATGTGASVREWHVGPVFRGSAGYHQYVVEFLVPPADLRQFRDEIDAELVRVNDDYAAHRAPGVGIAPPAVLAAAPGAFEGWMRRRGKLGGQNKVPRVDGSGALTRELLDYLRETGRAGESVPPTEWS